MSKELILAVVGLVLFIALLSQAERALLQVMQRRLDRSRRVIRALLFLVGILAWGYGSSLLWYRSASGWWFVIFLVVAGAWKLIIDVLVFGVPDRGHRAGSEPK